MAMSPDVFRGFSFCLKPKVESLFFHFYYLYMKKIILLSAIIFSFLIFSQSATAQPIAPTITGVTASNADGAYKTGAIIHIQVSFSENVIVTGVPQIVLSTGSPAFMTVNYGSGSGSSTLTFEYPVIMGNMSSDLDYAATNSLFLNGGTIKNSAGVDANVTLPAPGATGSLSANKNIVINTALPVLTEVTPVPTLTDDNTPDYTFSSSQAGSIIYAGDCNSPTTRAMSGNNTLTFNRLSNGIYTNCTLTVINVVQNFSNTLRVSAFTVSSTAPTQLPIAKTKKMVNITPTGNATLSGVVKSTGAAWLTVVSWGGEWIINVTEKTKFANHLNVANFVAGDGVEIQGKISSDMLWTITAKNIKSSSARKRVETEKKKWKR